MTENTVKNASWVRIILGSLLVTILAVIHFNLLLQGKYLGVLFLITLGLTIYTSKKKKVKNYVKKFQFKTASILSFLLPISAFVYSGVIASSNVKEAGSEAAQAGAAIGSVIGGGLVIFLSFILGISLGIAFYMMSKTNKAEA